jgi:urease accessory protein
LSQFTRALITLALASAALPAHPHPLQSAAGDFAAGLAHPFFGLDHLLAAVAVGIWATRLGGRAIWLVPLCFVCGIVGGGVIGLYVGASEPLVAASVVVLGVLVTMRRQPPLVVGAAVASLFALLHGIAHTSGVSSASWPLVIAGLAAGTAVCHAVAIGAAVTAPKARRLAGVAITLAGCYLLAGTI